MRLRLKSVLATLVTTGMLAGMLGFAQIAQAQTAPTPPPFEPDPAARGCLNFYDANGNLKTSGSINDSPIAAFAMGDGPSRPGDNAGTLYAAQPEPGQPSQSWFTDQMSPGNPYPSTDPATPANLRNSPNPLYVGVAGDGSMANELANLPHPASDAGTAYDGAYQIRFITSGPATGTDTLYWRAAIKVSGTTWTQTWCPPPAQATGTTTTLTAAPASPQTAGTTVNLTANVAPAAAVGSVQFQSDGANLGPAVSVTAGTATTSTNSLTAGTHSLTANFIPTDPTAFGPSTSNAVSYTITGPAASVDLGITKTGPATATVNSPITYNLTATNNGPDAGTGATVTDTLPSGVGFVSASSSQGTCTNASGTVTCGVGALASGGSATITINATAPAAAGTITNSATIGGNETDPNPANNTASASTDVSVVTVASTDLAITKTGPATATVGGPITYNLTATNNGPSDATGVAVSDTLPAGVTFNSASSSQGSCLSIIPGQVFCALDALANGASASITINATAPTTAGTITNSATISGNETDPNPANNTASATTQVGTVTAPSTDLAITKTGPASATTSSPITYNLSATNNGPSDATGVVVSDTLPAGVGFVSASSGCTNASGTVTCNVGALANGASASITINATAPATAGTITNSATIGGNETDPNPANNTASASTDVTAVTAPSTDLAITKTGPASATTSSPITYNLSATNNGPSDATGVTVSDTLPSGVGFVSASSSMGTCTNASGTVTCDIGALANGASAAITINATAPATAGTITNSATIAGNETDPNPANNTASATTQVGAPPKVADLAITKTGPATATVGSPITYNLTASNNGPDDATGVVVSDTLPAGVGFVSASSSMGTCANASGTVTCDIGALANGASAAITINATAPATAGTITNSATITGNETDPSPANNSASASTQVAGTTGGGSADLSITKRAFAGSEFFFSSGFRVSNTFTYVLTVRNLGPSTATGVTVVDHLPAGVTFRRVSTTNGTCTQAGGTVTCALGTLKRGRIAAVTIRVIPTTTGKITNTATVSGDQPDPHTGNNSSSVTITVTRGFCFWGVGDCQEGGTQQHALLDGLLSGLRFD